MLILNYVMRYSSIQYNGDGNKSVFNIGFSKGVSTSINHQHQVMDLHKYA